MNMTQAGLYNLEDQQGGILNGFKEAKNEVLRFTRGDETSVKLMM